MKRDGPAPDDGAHTYAWLVGRHLDRVMEALTAPVMRDDLDADVWRSAISYAVYGLVQLASPLMEDAPDLPEDEDAGDHSIEFWLETYGEVVRTLHTCGVLSKRPIPTEDAREALAGAAEG